VTGLSSKPIASSTHLPALTGVRFLLAFWVILHHIAGPGRMLGALVQTFPVPVQTFLISGFFAVPTFFTLSGFVLARNYSATQWNRTSLVRYGIARWVRIYPVYVISLLIIAPLMFRDLVSAPKAALQGQEWPLFLNYVMVLQGWSGELPVSWNTPAWSLSCEFFFYLCFPLILVLLGRGRRRSTIVAACAGMGLPVFLRAINLDADWKPLWHVGDFLLGIACSGIYSAMVEYWPKLVGKGYWLYWPAAVGTGLVASFPWVAKHMHVNDALRPLNVMLLLGLALGGGWLARWLSTRTVLLLGDSSYSTYILHVPVLWWYKRNWLRHFSFVPAEFAAVLYVAIVLLLCVMVFKVYESPLNKHLRKALWARFAPSPTQV
jgi:peptidoglycan/LPS O-acetylase OafA/YrhL